VRRKGKGMCLGCCGNSAIHVRGIDAMGRGRKGRGRTTMTYTCFIMIIVCVLFEFSMQK